MKRLVLALLALSCASSLMAKVLISEIVYDAKKPYKSDDWVEICNYGDSDADVSGWQLGDDKYDEGGTLFTLPANTVLAPGECLVIYSAADFTSVYPAVANAYGPSDIGYGKSSDSVVLLNENGKVKCLVEYATADDGGPWPAGSAKSNVLRLPYSDDPETWPAWGVSASDGGSPGTLNPETCGLSMYKHSRNPNAPTSVASPEIHLWVKDEIAASGKPASVTLYYGIGESGAKTAQPMTNLEGDEWVCNLPVQPEGTAVFYYGEAADASGNTAQKFWNAQGQDYLYVVTDSPVYSGIVMNEIMYHCLETAYTNAKGNCKNYEYVELFNRTEGAIDLSYWRFETESVKLRFPAGTSLAAGGYLVLTDKQAAIETVYDFPETSQILEDGLLTLSNSGEKLSLQNANGQEVDLVNYKDKDPWPTEPDGSGKSLELKSPLLDNSLPESWQASQNALGTPGKANTLPEPAAACLVLALLAAAARRR